LADRLHLITTKVLGSRCPWKRSTWADHMRLLTDDVGGDLPRVTAALEWFATHAEEQYTPKPKCAKSFRAKFSAMEQAMARHAERNPPEIEIEPKAASAAKAILRNRWPAPTAAQIPHYCQLAVNEYAAFIEKAVSEKTRLKDIAKPSGADRRALHFIETVLAHFTGAEDFVVRWFNAVYARVGGWAAWSGNLRAEAFTPAAKEFQKMGVAWATAYAGVAAGPKVWADFMERVGCNAG